MGQTNQKTIIQQDGYCLVKIPNPALELAMYTIEDSATTIYLKTEKPSQIPSTVQRQGLPSSRLPTLPGILYVQDNPENGWGK